MEKRTALVLGATGNIGGGIALQLVKEGWKVYGASRLTDKARSLELQDAGVHVICFDVMQDKPKNLPRVDVLFLEIWDPSHPSLTWAINFYGVGRVVERYAGVADVINGSTINVYGDSPEPAKEENPCSPTSYYGHCRYSQERLIDYFSASTGKKCINLRYAHVNTASRGVIRRFAKMILAETSLGRNPDAMIQVIALEDIVRMTLEAVDHMANPPVDVNICHPKVWTQRELAEAIREKLGRGRVVFDRASGGEETSAFADVSRMLEWFGEPRVSVDVLIDRVVADLE